MSKAPIALFIFNRPEHLSRTLDSLIRCEGFDPTKVFVFGDGPRSEDDLVAVAQARDTARQTLGHRAHYEFHDENRGLARSIVDGVTELTQRYGRAIVVEDDLQLSPKFLSFMNASLDKYAEAEKVKQVSGFNFSVPEFRALDEALFFPMISTWGWATWDRAWREFDLDAEGWQELQWDKEMRKRFDLEGAYDYTSMLQDQMQGKCDSWGIRWYWTVFRRSGIVCFPPQTLVLNSGMDGSGTHGGGFLKKFRTARNPFRVDPIHFSSQVEIDAVKWLQLRKAIWRLNGGLFGQFRSFLKRSVSIT